MFDKRNCWALIRRRRCCCCCCRYWCWCWRWWWCRCWCWSWRWRWWCRCWCWCWRWRWWCHQSTLTCFNTCYVRTGAFSVQSETDRWSYPRVIKFSYNRIFARFEDTTQTASSSSTFQFITNIHFIYLVLCIAFRRIIYGESKPAR